MDDENILVLRDLAAAYDAARRLAVNLFATHYKSQSPDWKLAPDFLGVIHQIDNMTAGLVKPVKPVPLPERRQEIRNILYCRLPALIDGNVCRDIADEVFRAIIGEQPNFRERMETFFRRHDMDDKQHAERAAGNEFLRGEQWSPDQQIESLRQRAKEQVVRAAANLPGAETSERIASIAGQLLHFNFEEAEGMSNLDLAILENHIRAVAASALRQRETAEPLTAFAGGFTDAQLTTDPLLRYFHYAHLPPQLQPTSAVFCRAARYVVDALPRNAERTVALRKLLEAKDAAVRANVEFTHPAPGKQETFLDRLLIENKELQERKAKLWDFIQSLGFLDLPSDEQARLRKQHTAMDQYVQILTERISNARHIQKLRDGQASASELFEKQYETAQQTKSIPASIAEQIDENVRVTGGGKSEEPLPFKD